jgi:hypothetical protein
MRPALLFEIKSLDQTNTVGKSGWTHFIESGHHVAVIVSSYLCHPIAGNYQAIIVSLGAFTASVSLVPYINESETVRRSAHDE